MNVIISDMEVIRMKEDLVVELIKNCPLGHKDVPAKDGVCTNFMDCDYWSMCPYRDL